MKWLHIIADFKKIDFWKLKINEKILKNFFDKIISENNVTQLWAYYHTFWKENEITWVIALAESHISFHTWPEFKYISFDIFVCNLKNENSEKAEKIFEQTKKFFDCKVCEIKKIERKK